MQTFKLEKPKNTTYCDFNFCNNSLYAIFEINDGRTHNVKVCDTKITNESWIIKDDKGKIKGFKGDIKETKKYFTIKLKS